MRHVLSARVENKPGVLQRITGLISRRGFNIESLSVGPTQDPAWSCLVAVVEADNISYEQITKQLNKLVSVYKVNDLTAEPAIERELVLFKVGVAPEQRGEVIEIANVFRAKIVNVGRDAITIEATGDSDKLDAMEELLRSYQLRQITRTGITAMPRD